MGGESIPIGSNIAGRLDSTRVRPNYLEVLYRWIFTVDHKKLGILYISYGLVFLLVAGVEALMIRIQLFFPHNTFVSLFVYNRLFTMHGTTMVFFCRHAPDLRVRQLSCSADDRSAGHGVPAPERLQLLDERARGSVALLQLRGWNGSGRDRFRARCGLVRIRPTDRARLLSRSHNGLLDSIVAPERRRQHRRGNQYPRYGVLHAMQRDDPLEDSIAALALRYRLIPRSCSSEPAHRMPDNADDRPLPGRTFLRYRGRRFGDALGTLLLDLRTPGGLRTCAARLRRGQRNHSSLLAQSHLRLSG